jgi:hypothetical protein
VAAAAARRVRRRRRVRERAAIRLLTPRYVALGAGLLVALVVGFGGHIRHGGFVADDWTNLATYRYGPHGGGLGAVGDYRRVDLPSANHAAQSVLFTAEYGLLGGHVRLHILLTLALAALLSVALFAFVRELGAPPGFAVALAVLAFVYPWSDANRFWIACDWNNLALALYFAGAVVGLRRGPHVVTFAAFVAAILTYELVAVAVALTGALYLTRMPRREALMRWAADVVAAVAGVLLMMALTPRTALGSTSEKLHHAGVIAEQSLTIWADTLWPFGGLGRGAAVAILLVALTTGAWRRSRWLLGAAGGIAFVIVGYAVLVPGEDFYTPLYPGIGNRVNLMAGIGMIAVALSLVAMVARPRIAIPLAAAFLAVGFVVKLRDHSDDYTRSASIQAAELRGLRALVPHPPPGTTIYLRQPTPESAPGISTFSWRWDLSGATQITYGDGSVHGYPILPGNGLVCERDAIHPRGNGLETFSAPYGHAVLVDLQSNRVLGADSPADCRRSVTGFAPA